MKGLSMPHGKRYLWSFGHTWIKYTAVHSYYLTKQCIYFDTSLTFPNGLPEASAAAARLHTHNLSSHERTKQFKALFDHICPRSCPSFPLANASCKLCLKSWARVGQCWFPSKLQEPADGPGPATRGGLRLGASNRLNRPFVIVNLGDPGALTLDSKDFSVRRSRFPT